MSALVSYGIFLLLVYGGFLSYGLYLGNSQRRRKIFHPYRQVSGLLILSICLSASVIYLSKGVVGLPDSPKNYDVQTLQNIQNHKAEVQRLQKILQDDPENVNAQLQLARLWGEVANYSEAEAIYQKLLQQPLPVKVAIGAKLMLGETMILGNEGEISQTAQQLFTEVLAQDENNIGAHYYLNLYRAQQGFVAEAKQNLQKLYDQVPQDSPWRKILLTQLGAELPSVKLPSLDPEIIADAEQLTPEERSAMIEQMVAGLALKQQQKPDNLQGWLRLVRAYGVLGNSAKQIDALRNAVRLAADDIALSIELTRLLRKQNQGKQNAEIIELLQVIYRKDPKNIEALWFLALADVEANQLAKAKVKFQKAINLLPENSEQRKELEKYIKNVLE